MDSVTSNLLSGLIGALIGASISFYVHYRSRLDAARQKLLGLVYRLGFQSWWNPESGKPALIFHDNYPALWEAYAELRRYLPVWRRKSLDKAWQKYMRIEYYDEIPDDEPWKVFQKGTVTSRDEAVRVSGEFVRFLTNMR
jgi:hypothetical protein